MPKAWQPSVAFAASQVWFVSGPRLRFYSRDLSLSGPERDRPLVVVPNPTNCYTSSVGSASRMHFFMFTVCAYRT